MIPKVIACDFDGTLSYTRDTYPEPGEPNWELIEKLKAERKNGAVFILWTCRTDEAEDIAVAACEHWGIRPDYVNENVPWMMQAFGNNPRKIFADEYWDDRAIHIEFNPRGDS